MSYVPPWKRTAAAAPGSTTLTPIPSAPTLQTVLTHLGARRMGSVNLFSSPPVKQPQLSVKELMALARSEPSISNPPPADPSRRSAKAGDPTHPMSTLISFIQIIPLTQPYFPREIWFHTNATLVLSDSRNIGRPIPLFGDPGTPGDAAAAHRVGRGRDEEGGKFMGWWVVEGMRKVEGGGKELVDMLAAKEANQNYGPGRTPQAWRESLTQTWAALTLHRLTPAELQKWGELVNPLEMVGMAEEAGEEGQVVGRGLVGTREGGEQGQEGGEAKHRFTKWEVEVLKLVAMKGE